MPQFLENKRILSLDLSSVVAGTKYRGQFEERLKKIMAELKESAENIVNLHLGRWPLGAVVNSVLETKWKW